LIPVPAPSSKKVASLSSSAVPSDDPSELFPYTLHAQHRRFGDPRELELYLTFLEPHRIRYTTTDGIVHDEYIEVKYEFTTIEGSIQLQSDIRRRDLIDWFDVDVVWSDRERRTDSYGNVRGLGTIQRIKLWRDRYSTFHYLTFYANHRRRWKEYLLDDFDTELRQRDDRHRRLQLGARGARRGSASESSQSQRGNRERRFSATSIFRSSQRNPPVNGNASSSSSAAQSALDIRYLGIQFSRNANIQAGSDGKCTATCFSPTALLSCAAGLPASIKIAGGSSTSGMLHIRQMPNSRQRFRQIMSSCHRHILMDIMNTAPLKSTGYPSYHHPNCARISRPWPSHRTIQTLTRLSEMVVPLKSLSMMLDRGRMEVLFCKLLQ
jgi:hypothetical protein